MSKIAVVYCSTSGFTKKYAEWIAEECNADLFDAKKIGASKLAPYDVIVYGGSLHVVGISGLNLIKNNATLLRDKRVIVFAVGASPPRENVLAQIRKHNFENTMANVELFYLRGGFDYSKLDWTNKVLMTLLKVRLKLKKTKTPDEVGMLAAYAKPMDFTKKDNIKNIVEYAKNS
jgi:menaquinone-dependent protoporphyrinogen IX oxidase